MDVEVIKKASCDCETCREVKGERTASDEELIRELSGCDDEAARIYGQEEDPPAKGLKYDAGKQPWFAMPLVILKPLADVFAAGERKYDTFNCLNPFDDPERRFWDAAMRHMEACQLNPLARDAETGCYHAAQVAFSVLMRLYHCKR